MYISVYKVKQGQISVNKGNLIFFKDYTKLTCFNYFISDFSYLPSILNSTDTCKFPSVPLVKASQ